MRTLLALVRCVADRLVHNRRAEEGILLCVSSFWGKESSSRNEESSLSTRKRESFFFFFFFFHSYMKARTRRLSLKPSNKTPTNKTRGGSVLFSFGRRRGGGNVDIVLINSQKQTALSKMEEGGWGGERTE